MQHVEERKTRGAMGSFGEKLRREREARGVTLDEIAKVTKIGTRSLKALEDENFSILPGGIFNKGFVRAYARFLGMNEEEAVAEYQKSANDQPLSVKTIAAQSAMAKANKLAAQQAREAASATRLLREALILALGLALVFGAYISYRRGYLHAVKFPGLHRKTKLEAQAAKSEAARATVPAPAISGPTVPQVAPVSGLAADHTANPRTVNSEPAFTSPPARGEFTVRIKTSEECWLSVVADGRNVAQRTFEPGEEQSIAAQTNVHMVIGNPGGMELSLNGKVIPLGGDLDRPRKITVEAGGLTAK